MRTLGIIPARAGSTRLPQKNLRPIQGVPLIRRTIETARSAQRLDRLVVSSNDEQILEIAGDYDDLLALERPEELSGPESLAIEFVRHALSELERTEEAFDAVAIIQVTSPLTEPGDIDGTIALLEESGADSAVTACAIDFAIHPSKLKRLDGDRLVPFLTDESAGTAFDQLPELYVRNGSVYACRRSTVERGSLLGEDSRAFLMPRERSVDVNDELDLEFAEFLLARRSR